MNINISISVSQRVKQTLKMLFKPIIQYFEQSLNKILLISGGRLY